MEPPTELKPFQHQVAGQSLILRYDHTTICKSAMSRERQFYLSYPSALTGHIPGFKGVIQIPLPDTITNGLTPHNEIEQTSDWSTQNGDSSQTPLSANQVRGLKKSSIGDSLNGHSAYEFLLLEDLVSRFDKPCVLDLKMGTRQHGDDAPAEKVAYQVNKCKNTTSATLGLRLCGMKKFIPTTGQFEVKDKKHGRRLRDAEIPHEISAFLSKDGKMRQDISRSILRRLKQLRSAISRLDGFRFFSCSVLIIYEGSLNKPDLEHSKPSLSQCDNDKCQSSSSITAECGSTPESPNVELSCDKVMDSIDSTESNTANNFQGPDSEIQSGFVHDSDQNQTQDGSNKAEIESQQREHNDILNSPSLDQNKQSDSSGENLSNNSLNTHNQVSMEQVNSANEHLVKNSVNSTSRNLPSRDPTDCSDDCVEVRVVDFAHATFPGFTGGHSVHTHTGPDEGFLLGVDSLIAIISDLLTHGSGHDNDVTSALSETQNVVPTTSTCSTN